MNPSSTLQHRHIRIPAVYYNIGISQSQQYITKWVHTIPAVYLKTGPSQSQQYITTSPGSITIPAHISRWVYNNNSSIFQHTCRSITIQAIYLPQKPIPLQAVYFNMEQQSKHFIDQVQSKQYLSTCASNNPSNRFQHEHFIDPSSIYLLVPVTIPVTDFNMSTSLIQAVSIYLCQ